MSAFKEMADAFREHVGQWGTPPACNPARGRYAVLACNWVSTSVPFFSMEIACALRQQGCEVVVLWDAARVGVMSPSEEETKIIAEVACALPAGVEVIEVAGPAPTLPDSVGQAVERIFRDNAIWFAKGEAPASELLKGKGAEREAFLEHAAVVLQCLQSCGADRVILPGGIFGLGGIYAACAMHLGLPHTTYDMGWASIMVSHGGCAAHFQDFKAAFTRTREIVGLDSRLGAYVKQAAIDIFHERTAGKDVIQTQKLAGTGIDYDCDVLVCLNNRSDTAALNREKLFTSVTHWLSSINEWSLKNPQYRIYIRQHPHERYDWLPNEENYPEMIRAWDPDGSRLRLIDAKSDVNTYDLLRCCKVVLPFTSTIGVESAYQGKPVITSTLCYYGGLGFTWDPDTPEAYFDLVGKGLRGEISTPAKDSSDRAGLSLLIVLKGTSLPTRFVPDDCRGWAREAPQDLWNESPQKLLLDCLINITPLAYLAFLQVMLKATMSTAPQTLLQQTMKWLRNKAPSEVQS